MPTLRQIPDSFVNKWSAVKVKALENQEHLDKFKKAILWVKTQIEPK